MADFTTLYYRDVAPLRPFHAAAATFRRRGDRGSGRHDHDFHEMMLVIEGSGSQWLNGVERVLSPGDLFLIRPRDCHGITLGRSSHLHIMNIAFPSDTWLKFASVALPPNTMEAWQAADGPASSKLTGDDFDRIAASFRRVSLVSKRSDERLELVRFWTDIVGALISRKAHSPDNVAGEGPQWLANTLRGASSPGMLSGGVPALVAAAGVSAAHFSRTLKAVHGVTPTQYVNEARLRRGAMLLATSSMEIIDIAFECGFENLSYFYREFRKQYGSTPRQYRGDERRRIAP